MPIRYQPDVLVAEGTTPEVSATLVDAAGTAIPANSLATLTLTLYELTSPTHAIVNSVDAVNILNADRGTVDANGLLTITLEALDTAILDATHRAERRVLLVEFTYGVAGEKVGRFEIIIPIQNLEYVP